MKKIYFSLVAILLCVSQVSATLVIPPSDLGDMMHTSGIVVYGTIQGHQNGDEYINRFEIIESIKGGFNIGDEILVQEYSTRRGTNFTRVSGDVNFEIGKKYLLFLGQTGNGTYKLQYLALSAYEEGIIQGERVFAHNAALLDIVMANPENVNINGLKGVYQVSSLVNHLKSISTTYQPFNETQAGIRVYGTYDPINNLRNANPWGGQTASANRAPCGDGIPCHCTTVFGGDTTTPAAGNPDQSSCNATAPGKFINNNWTVCIAGNDGNGDGDLNDGGDTGGDPSTTTEVADLMNAVNTLNCMPGVNITFDGINTCATACGVNDAAGDAKTCSDAMGQDNKIWVFFNDPCNEVPFDPTPGSCAGVLGVGGSFGGGTCHVDPVCGLTWQTNLDPFFIMNNGSGCVGQYSYTAVLVHEMLHAIGVGHIGGESGDATIMGSGCAAIDGTTPDGAQCTALMNPVVCNANPGNNAPKFGVTTLDEACTDWMYNPTSNSSCNISNVMVTNVMCDNGTGVLTFDVTFDYVDADDDMNGVTTFDIEVGGTTVTTTGTVINSGTVNTGNATVSVSQMTLVTGGTVTVRSSEIFSCFGQDLTVTIPACPLTCDATSPLPTYSVADVCAGDDVVVDLGGCNYGGIFFFDSVDDPTCIAADATWRDYLDIPAINVFDADPTAGPANLLGFDDAGGGCVNVTLAAANFPNTTCDPIQYTVFIRAGTDRYCANIDAAGPTIVEVGDYLSTNFQDCPVIPITFTVNPVPMTAPMITNSGTCSDGYMVVYNCPTESGVVTGTLPSSGMSGAGTVDILVTNSQGTCTMNFANVPFGACVPVELLTFDGEYRDGINYLKWETATELNNEYFMVERSLDGIKFEELGKVLGSGTTTEMKQYNYMDVSPSLGINYYRLKQVDTDGTYEYSNVISISTDKDNVDAKIYPSPTSTFLNVEVNKEMDEVEIVDLTGRVLLSSVYKGTNQARLDVSTLPVGTYFVNIKLENTIKTMRFVKN